MHYRTLLREVKYPNVTTFARNIPLRALRHYSHIPTVNLIIMRNYKITIHCANNAFLNKSVSIFLKIVIVFMKSVNKSFCL